MVNEIYHKDKPIYNSRLVEVYLKLIKKEYPHVDKGDILRYAGIKEYEVEDQAHWFTQTQVDRFVERLVKITGNDNIAREAGRHSASPDALGLMRQYVLGLLGPANAFKLIGQTTSKFTKSASYFSESIGPNKVKVTVTPFQGIKEKPFQCKNRMGFWEAILMVFGQSMPKIEHPECIFKGDKSCTYIISWKQSLSLKLKNLRVYLTPVMLCLFAVMMSRNPNLAINFLAPSFSLAFISLSFFIEKIEKREILGGVGEIKDSTDHLIEQINRNYNNALIANEIGKAISSQTDFAHIEQTIDSAKNIDGTLIKIIQILQKRLDYDRGLILLATSDKSKLVFRAGYGYSAEHQNMLQAITFHLNKPDSKGMFVVSFHKQEPLLVNDLGEMEYNLSPRSLEFARALQVKSFICCPIICDGESIGVLAVDNVQSKRPLVNSDLTLLMGIAPVIGVSIRNADLLNTKRQQFHSILLVLAKTIDARDPLTAGHSGKVTEYALGICKELGEPQNFCEMIRVAALLHDYGKIAVPDSILKKPGRLTRDEYEVVKTHSQKTREILDQINFEGIYQSVPEVAGAHHEKLNGTGYPQGLKGNQIPLGAKIIAVADFFEAITSMRHYRDPMPLRVAFDLLREESGKHFDPTIVEAFIRYFDKNYANDFKGKWGKNEIPERKSLRVPYNVPVSYTINGTTQNGTSKDISALGMYVASKQEVVDAGCPINLSFALPNEPSHVIEASGRIAWVNNNDVPRKTAMPPGFGVEFVGLKKIATDVVFSYVLAQHIAV